MTTVCGGWHREVKRERETRGLLTACLWPVNTMIDHPTQKHAHLDTFTDVCHHTLMFFLRRSTDTDRVGLAGLKWEKMLI